ncbi:uncharacterized protein LOC124423692 [Vespa crabro]|uniref:uncharacterized protein LOC124423692 n=1 Tax=Vespa crabro TaxID=7445 RepID=UPI001F0114AA|nr:uncharacterized protein LOC124423692 [Vespa crabro]
MMTKEKKSITEHNNQRPVNNTSQAMHQNSHYNTIQHHENNVNNNNNYNSINQILAIYRYAFQGISLAPPKTATYNFKRANWRKFAKQIDSKIQNKNQLPTNRNLSIKEIDESIVSFEQIINKSIREIIPKNQANKYDYYQKYVSNNIKKLHSTPLKSSLITRLQFIRYRSPYNHIKHEIYPKNINYKEANEFFPIINKYLRPQKHMSIENFLLNLNKNEFNQEIGRTMSQLVYENEIYITDPMIKLEVMGMYLERINSSRYTNGNTIIKNKTDDIAQKYQDIRRRMRNTKSTFMTFSDQFPAHDSLQRIK